MNEPIVKTSFDIEVARKLGTDAAIILANIEFWCEKNRANNKNLYEGKYWTYNSQKAFTKLFPWMSERVVRFNINKLVKSKLVERSYFNKTKMDHTAWYSAIRQNCLIDATELSNGSDKIDALNIDNSLNTDQKKNNKKKDYESEAKTFLEAFNKIRGTNYNSVGSFINNFIIWRDSYSVEQMIQATKRSYFFSWFNEAITPQFLFRTRNKNGECDYIGDLLSKNADRSSDNVRNDLEKNGGTLE